MISQSKSLAGANTTGCGIYPRLQPYIVMNNNHEFFSQMFVYLLLFICFISAFGSAMLFFQNKFCYETIFWLMALGIASIFLRLATDAELLEWSFSTFFYRFGFCAGAGILAAVICRALPFVLPDKPNEGEEE